MKKKEIGVPPSFACTWYLCLYCVNYIFIFSSSDRLQIDLLFIEFILLYSIVPINYYDFVFRSS